jgi:outer membrane protein insertion porin family
MLLSVLTLALLAQAQPDTPFPVKSVTARGNRVLTIEQVAAAAGIKVGSMTRPSDMDKAMQRLLSCGYFDRVSYRYEPKDQGFAIEWDVQEVTVFYPVFFEDLPFPAAEAKQLLAKSDPLFGDKIPVTQDVLKRYEDILNQRANPADPEDRIRGALAANDKGDLVALFRPRRIPPTVSQVEFTGNQLIRSEELLPVISPAAVGVVYKETDFHSILDIKIRPMYEARGRLNVSFPEITTTKSDTNLGLNVKVKVVEGDEYNLGEIRFAGEPPRDDDWLRIGNFRQGVTANMSEVEEGRRRIENAVKRLGYLDAKLTAKRTLNAERKSVDIEFTFNNGGKYTFNRLDIKGLDIISEPEVRKIWGMKVGAAFNPEYPDFFLKKLREDGVFDNLGDTRSIPEINYERHTVNVTLVFKGEAPKKDDKRRRPF